MRITMASKLELTWYGKENEISVEPRLLIEPPELSNTAAVTASTSLLPRLLIRTSSASISPMLLPGKSVEYGIVKP